jgi:hypothetical protein
MKSVKFVNLTAETSRALKIVERELTLPQRSGTILAELAALAALRTDLAAKAADTSLSGEARQVVEEQLEEVLSAQACMDHDLATDPGGYLVWFLADGNTAMLKRVQRFTQ